MFIKYEVGKKSEVSHELEEAFQGIGMLKSLYLSFIIVERSGKLIGNKSSEIKLVTSLLVSSRNAVNLKLFWFQVQCTSEENLSNPKVSTFKKDAKVK